MEGLLFTSISINAIEATHPWCKLILPHCSNSCMHVIRLPHYVVFNKWVSPASSIGRAWDFYSLLFWMISADSIISRLWVRAPRRATFFGVFAYFYNSLLFWSSLCWSSHIWLCVIGTECALKAVSGYYTMRDLCPFLVAEQSGNWLDTSMSRLLYIVSRQRGNILMQVVLPVD